MKRYSNESHYTDSEGNRWTPAQIQRKIDEAKPKVIEKQRDDYGYNFCVTCKRSDLRLECSHLISVNECKNNPDIPLEKAWEVDNMKMKCNGCHSKYDNNDVRF